MSRLAKLIHAIGALPRRTRTLLRQPWRRQLMVVESFAMLALARVWLLVRPFKSVAKHLSMPASQHERADVRPGQLDDPRANLAREVSRIVRWVARFAPFRAVCIHQAIAARLMLRRRNIPSIMYFGVTRKVESGGIKLAAHAWLQAGQVEVTGFDEAGQFQEIARFE